MERNDLRVRAGTQDDLPFVLGLVPRLTEFGAPAWRPAEAIEHDSAQSLRRALQEPDEQSVMFIAEGPDGERLGFVYIEVEADYITGEERAFIGDLVVAAAAEGAGVGRALMAAADTWARERDLGSLTLYVFAGNQRARKFYAGLGFQEDGVRMILPLPEKGEAA